VLEDDHTRDGRPSATKLPMEDQAKFAGKAKIKL